MLVQWRPAEIVPARNQRHALSSNLKRSFADGQNIRCLRPVKERRSGQLRLKAANNRAAPGVFCTEAVFLVSFAGTPFALVWE
jgi:hypothetical protein